MRISILIALMIIVLSAGITFADPDNFGGKGEAWEKLHLGVGTVYIHKETTSHNLSFNSGQDAVKRFSQPGKAEGKASGNSVISNDPVDLNEHPGTQVLPGRNRRDGDQ